MKVLKDFTTPSSRFTAGQNVTAADLAGDFMSLADRAKGGFIVHDGGIISPRADVPIVARDHEAVLPPLGRARKGDTA